MEEKGTLGVEGKPGCPSLLRKAKKRPACRSEDSSSRLPTEDAFRLRTRKVTINQKSSLSRPDARSSSQDRLAINEFKTDKHQVSATTSESQVQLLREQATRQASFLDLLIDLVPFDALIPHEATSCSETTLAGITSRGMLRWSQRRIRYDPDVLRATSVCLEQHVRSQEKSQAKPGIPSRSHGAKKANLKLSWNTERRREHRRGKRRKQKHGYEKGRGGQRQGKNWSRTQQEACAHESAQSDCGRLASGEVSSNRNMRRQGVNESGRGLGGSLDGRRARSRERTYAGKNQGVQCAGSSPGCEGEGKAGNGAKRRLQGDSGTYRSSDESFASEKNSTHSRGGAKRWKKVRKYHARPD